MRLAVLLWLFALGAAVGLVWRLRRVLLVLVISLGAACGAHRGALPATLGPGEVTFVNDTAEPTTLFLTIPARSEVRVQTIRRHR